MAGLRDLMGGSTREALGRRLASDPKALSNPVNRYLLGLPTEAPGAQVREQVAPMEAAPQQQPDPVWQKLLKRVRTVSETGLATPGPGTIPGAALRPEVQAMFKDLGGPSAIDVSNMSPEEEKALRLIIDPTWKPSA